MNYAAQKNPRVAGELARRMGHMSGEQSRRLNTRHRGVIFITALGIIVILTGLALVFAQSMRTEALASANRRSEAEADAIEQGAEQWVLAQSEAYQTDAMTITQVPAEAIQVGSGYFWILTPDPDSDQDYLYGITDEASKLNINSATSEQLLSLPTDMTQEVADAITDWRNLAGLATSDGAESDYYESLTEPYECKNAPYETLEELLLVKGMTPQFLWGYDMNRDGVIDDAERQAAGSTAGYSGGNSGIDDRGIFNYLTCYTPLTTTAGGAPTARININTASEPVLIALGISDSDAEDLIDEREGNDYTNTSWATSTVAKYGTAVTGLLTGTSHQYSADIVAVSGDGRAFKRVRIVVDVTTLPAKIVYRKDLTSLGWPLPQEINQDLRSGKGIQTGMTGSNMTSSGTLGQTH
jgi:type II secretory pathway component PulK